jgi:hypothetical protein
MPLALGSLQMVGEWRGWIEAGGGEGEGGESPGRPEVQALLSQSNPEARDRRFQACEGAAVVISSLRPTNPAR